MLPNPGVEYQGLGGLHKCFFSDLLMWPGNAGSALLLDLAATDDVGERAHVITDGLAETEQQLMPFLGFLAKSHREANFPTQILTKLGQI